MSEKRHNDDGLETVAHYRDVPVDTRKALAKKGHAMPDGSFPIENSSDLHNAIQSIGRATDRAGVMALIKRRAKDLGAMNMLPATWSQHSDEKAFELDGVEIFATGNHKGDVFTEADLDEMARAFNELDFQPPLKQGHMRDQPGMPALGYVTDLRRVGQKLVAKFSDMPQAVMDALRRKSYNRVSAEVYFNLARGGKTFKRALKAVALLGADIPAVAGLAPLSSLFNEIDAEVRVFDFEAIGDDNMSDKEKEELEQLRNQNKEYEDKMTAMKIELDQLKTKGDNDDKVAMLSQQLETMSKNYDALAKKDHNRTVSEKVDACTIPAFRPMLTHLYSLAMSAPAEKVYSLGEGDKTKKDLSATDVLDALVGDINAKADKLFSEESRQSNSRKEYDDDPSVEVDKRVREYQAKHTDVNYSDAMELVLSADEDLKNRYAVAMGN